MASRGEAGKAPPPPLLPAFSLLWGCGFPVLGSILRALNSELHGKECDNPGLYMQAKQLPAKLHLHLLPLKDPQGLVSASLVHLTQGSCFTEE